MRPVSAVTATRYMSSVVIVSSLPSFYTLTASCLDRLGPTTWRALGADMAPPQERDERERRSCQRNDRQHRNDNQPQNEKGQRVGERRRPVQCKPADHERKDGLGEQENRHEHDHREDRDVDEMAHSATDDSMFASRTMTQRPSGSLRRIDNTGPARFTGTPPPARWTSTARWFQQYAQSPNTRTSWMSLTASIRMPLSASWAATKSALPRIGDRPGTRKTASSAIRSSTRSLAPAAEALIQVATRSRIAFSS